MKKINESDYIQNLISEGEHQQQDFKFEISDVKKIAKSISAFANTDGGRLLIGVKDNGKIAGIHSEEEIYMIEAASTLYCTPSVKVDISSYYVHGKTILVAQVPQCKQRPICAHDESGRRLAYVRIKDENILASPIHLKVWQQENKLDGELLKFTDLEQQFLDLLVSEKELTLNQYCKRVKINKKKAELLLAKLIRYDIVELVFKEHKFFVKLKG